MSGKRKTVTLVSPGGAEVTSDNPTEAINLIYGQGYRPKRGSVDDAIDAVTTPGASSAETSEDTPEEPPPEAAHSKDST
jgi:hypothetical protein